MWLNGFMDNIPNYPLQPCYYEKCPRLNDGNNKNYIKNTINGPFGSGKSYPLYNGFCPVTTPIYLNKKISNTSISNEKKNIFIYSSNNNNEYEKKYATIFYKELTTIFEKKTVGWIFWNFRTSSNAYSWNYLSLYNIGYIDNKYNNINIDNIKYLNIISSNNIILNYVIYLTIIIILLFVLSFIYKRYNIKYNEYKPINNIYTDYNKINITEKSSLFIKKNYVNDNIKYGSNNSINI
jgi:hypothetical protein